MRALRQPRGGCLYIVFFRGAILSAGGQFNPLADIAFVRPLLCSSNISHVDSHLQTNTNGFVVAQGFLDGYRSPGI